MASAFLFLKKENNKYNKYYDGIRILDLKQLNNLIFLMASAFLDF